MSIESIIAAAIDRDGVTRDDGLTVGRLVCSQSHALGSLKWQETRFTLSLRRLAAENARLEGCAS